MVVNYFSSAQVEQLLESISTHTTHPERLVISVVDNSLSPVEFEELRAAVRPHRQAFGSVLVTAAASNLGYGKGNNLALREAEASGPVDVAIVINPDVRVVSGDLYADACTVNDDVAYSASTTGQDGALAGVGTIAAPTSKSRQLRLDEDWSALDLAYPAGHFLAMAAGMWRASGGFDPDYFLYGEELDLTLRLGLTPAQIQPLPSVRVHHASGGTTGSSDGAKSTVTYRNATRSMVLLYRKHQRLRRWIPTMLIARVTLALHALVRGRIAEARAVASGIYDGLTHPLTRPARRDEAGTPQ